MAPLPWREWLEHRALRMSKTVFVTGGAGYVGSHCCKAFAEAGWNVVVYDNLSRGWADFVQWGPLVQGDILDPDHLTRAMQACKPDAVAHFAALAYVGESVTQPAEYYRTNTAGSLNVLTAMRASKVRDIVFSSTCATYGVPIQTPIDEGHPQCPINPYGWSKLFVERMLADHDAAYGMRYVALRYFNAAGADPEGRIGERHVPETHAIPLAIEAALGVRPEFTIYGNDFNTRDGTAVRDYIHVTDLADAHLRALSYLGTHAKSETFNLGTGRGTSVAEMLDAVEHATARRIRRVHGAHRPGDPASLIATAAHALKTLQWQPQLSQVETMVRHALTWRDKQPGTRPGQPATA